ncbi:MAG TPA: ferrous iron transporter B, partial [Clostridiaceae bacterium]|nr:ferrous iron transporter B [Clostridiaceae bacterium]
FVFGVTIVFGFLEEIGYMARVSYAFDGSMAKLGLQGKSIMPLLVSLGCTIGGAAGTRVIDSWGQRLLTIALAWAGPCAATFAVIPTLASAFFGWAGILVIILLFIIALIHIRITATIFGRKLAPEEERHGLIMELPPYHKPRWGMLFKQTLIKIWGIFKKAFSVIIIVSVVFYFLAYSPDGGIEGSVLYKVGIVIEPVTRFFGMGWQTFIAFVSSMVSKEAVLGVLSAIFAGTGNIFDSTVGAATADAELGILLTTAISKPEALAFMIAVTFNIPCLMAVSSTYQESHSLKWTGRIAIYYIATALILSSLVFHIANIFM